MTRTWPLIAALTAALLTSCNDTLKPAPEASPTASAAQAASASPPAAPPAGTTAAPATTPAPATASALAYTPGVKTYDCGAKGQKPCPMQAWMKKVMAGASSSGDGPELAKALTYVADHAPPGYGDWSGFAKLGAAKAKAGDVDGAKATCKQCHDAYKEKYKTEMRDRPF